MTPAITELKRRKVKYKIHEYEHDPDCTSYGMEAAEKIGVEPERVYKTLIVQGGKEYFVGIVPVVTELNLKKLAKAAGIKKVKMAPKEDIEKITGYIMGGVSPFGQKRNLKTFICESAQNYETIFVSGGKRGLDVEIAVEDFLRITNALNFDN